MMTMGEILNERHTQVQGLSIVKIATTKKSHKFRPHYHHAYMLERKNAKLLTNLIRCP